MPKNPVPIVPLALVSVLAMAVALHASPIVMTPVSVLALVLLFMTGRQIGASGKSS